MNEKMTTPSLNNCGDNNYYLHHRIVDFMQCQRCIISGRNLSVLQDDAVVNEDGSILARAMFVLLTEKADR